VLRAFGLGVAIEASHARRRVPRSNDRKSDDGFRYPEVVSYAALHSASR
jgi:hypothetical protein